MKKIILVLVFAFLFIGFEKEEVLTCAERKKAIENYYDKVLSEWRNQMTTELYQQIMAEMQEKLEREVPECLN